jgi:TonB family protein
MKKWLPKMTMGLPQEPEPVPEPSKAHVKKSNNARYVSPPRTENTASEPSRPLRAWPSPPPPKKVECVLPVVAAESIFDDDLLYRSRVQTLFQREPSFSSAPTFLRKQPRRLLPSLGIAIAFLTVGYVISEPLYSKGAANSVVQISGRALDRTQAWLHYSDQDEPAAPAVQMAEDDSPQPASSRRGDSRIRVTPVRDPFQANTTTPAAQQPQALHVEAQAPAAQPSPAATTVRIPDSLKAPVQSATMRMAARITPSILAALEPVELSEDLSRRLLLQKVLPSYPEKAIRERLQGPVVLQAFIGRDGTIQDLKLIRGSLLLGQAAYHAVRQWRYQPYLVNGRAVEAQTLVTVDFKLP